jgi:integrase
MALTETAIKNAKPGSKNRKLYDGGGLFLLITPKGHKGWRHKYNFLGKEKLLSLGIYPDVKLKEARIKHAKNRKLIDDKIDPSANRKAEKAASLVEQSNSFELIAREWLIKRSSTLSHSHAKRVLRNMERNLFPWIGRSPISKLKLPEILDCIKKIEDKGVLETAHRSLGQCSQVFRYAVATGRAERDVTVEAKGALKPVQTKHLAAVTDPKKVGELLRTIYNYSGTLVVESALKLAPHVFVRPGELRKAEWNDIDFENSEWKYLVTKTKTEHIVPLSSQALKILNDIKILTGSGRYVFPNARSDKRPMTENAVLGAMRRLEIPKDEMCGHGFRAMARTILDEVLDYPAYIIEHQLAHSVKDPNGRAYNRTAHLDQRRKMMQCWSNFLDKCKSGNELILLRA